MQTTGFRRWGLVGVFIAIVIILGGAATFLLISQTGGGPSVTIIQPGAELVISAGQGLVVVAQVNASQPIERCELLVDGEVALQQALQPGESGPVTVSFPWFSTKPGRHTLSVVAYDSKQRPSAPAQVPVTVLKARTLADAAAEGLSTPAEPGASDGQADEGMQASPGDWGDPLQDDGQVQNPGDGPVIEGQQFGDLPLDPINPDAFPPNIFFGVSISRPGVQEIEVSFVAQADGDNPLDRIDFIRTRSNDGITVPYTEDCEGGPVCMHRDTFIMRATETWVVTAQAFDIAGQASELKMEVVQLLGENALGPAIVDGSFQVPAPQTPREAELAGNNGVLEVQDAVEMAIGRELVDDIGEPHIAEYRCSGRVVVLEVPYTYLSDHGDEVYVGAWAESGNTMVAAGNVRIEHGSGVARFVMEPIAPDLANTTEQLKLHLMASGGDYFYEEIVDMPITWPIPKPDLRVSYSIIRRVEQMISIQNTGCAPVEGFSLSLRPLNGEEVNLFIDETIAPGRTLDLYGLAHFSVLDPNHYSRGYQVVVDPENAIEEINEDNNIQDVGPITFKYIHVYQIDIHTTSEDSDLTEDSDEGEFTLYTFLNGVLTRRPSMDDWYWVLPEGSYAIAGSREPIIISPEIDHDQYLRISFNLHEDDPAPFYDDDNLGHIEFFHSSDMLQENNWKEGGAYVGNVPGKYSIYWRIVVEQLVR